MKQQFLSACAIAAISLLTANDSYGQQWTTSGPDLVTDPNTNFVGIKTNTPAHELTVNGDIGYEPAGHARSIIGNTSESLGIYSKGANWNDGSAILLNAGTSATDPGLASFFSTAQGGNLAFRFTDGLWNNHMTIDANSNAKITGGLEIGGDYSFNPITNNRHMFGNTDGALAIFSKNSWSNGSGMMFNGAGSNTTVDIVSNAANNNPAFRIVNSSWHPKLIVDGSGNTEIGGNYTFRQDIIDRNISGNTTSALWIHSNTDLTNGSAILMGSNTGPHPGSISFISQAQSAGSLAFRFVDPQWNNKLVIQGDGQVVIGNVPTVSASDYKLYVQTGILTEKIKVATVSGGNWSDFVFADNYELKSLNDVQNFIAENKHLPDVPSACDVEENGYDLTKMDATLLQKIEELTLYVIQQQKEIENLKRKVE